MDEKTVIARHERRRAKNDQESQPYGQQRDTAKEREGEYEC